MVGENNVKDTNNMYRRLNSSDVKTCVEVVARIFVGNNLFCYLIRVNRMLSYIRAESYDRMLGEFGVSLDDKSNIRRLGFKIPSGYTPESVVSLSCAKVVLEPTDSSKNDACRIFAGGVFNYDRNVSMSALNTVREVLQDYCNAKNINRSRVADERLNEFKNEFRSVLKCFERGECFSIFDVELNRVIGYASLKGRPRPMVTRKGEITATVPDCFISKEDADRLGLNVTVKSEQRLTYSIKYIKGKVYRTYCLCEIPYIGYYSLSVAQGQNGVDSHFKKCNNEDLGLSTNVLTSGGVHDNLLRFRCEELRLSGNVWFSNNGKSFLPQGQTMQVKETRAPYLGTAGLDNETTKVEEQPKGFMGLFKDALNLD